MTRLVDRLIPKGVPAEALNPAACHQFLDLMTVTWKGPDYEFIDRLNVLGIFQGLFSLQRNENQKYKQVTPPPPAPRRG